MKRLLWLVSMAAIVVGIVACDETVTKVTETTGTSLVEKGAKMPNCTAEKAGQMVYSVDSAAAFVCVDGKWQTLKGEKGEPGESSEVLKGDKGEDGKSCTAKVLDGGKGYKIVCGDDSVGVVFNGESASETNVEGCMLEDDGKGLVTVTCGEEEFTLYKALCRNRAYDPARQLCDHRDGHIYRTTTIGKGDSTQVWMAENLNYEPDTGSYCYEDMADSCAKYGRLYMWATAMGKAEQECGYGYDCTTLGTGRVRGLCPLGWHVPDTTEWFVLFKSVAGEHWASYAGEKLKAASGWEGDDGNGTDEYGFAALPAGYAVIDRSFWFAGYVTYFWTSTQFSYEPDEKAHAIKLQYDGDYPSYGVQMEYEGSTDGYKGYTFSLRCVQD